MKTKRFFAIALAITLFSSAASDRAQAQNQSGAFTNASSMTLTASTTGERVRITAPSTVVQIRLEVYSATGRKVFDNELRGGNVLDWHLRDGQAEPLADGAYLCVVTVKSLSGKLTQTIASLLVEKSIATMQATSASQMTPQQAEAIGPVEENATLTVLKEDEHPATTVVAHNGEEGQITRGRGALSFRLGDFFSGKDTEQMRLTPEGNLGIGFTHPQVRLDVDGVIRASRGIMFPDGTLQTTAALAGGAGQLPDQIAPGRAPFRSNDQNNSSSKRGKKNRGLTPEVFVNEDLTVNGNIIFTPPLPQAFQRDIAMQDNSGGLRFFGAPSLTTSPAAAAIQFWGTNSPFHGQMYLDSGAHNNAAVIIRTTGTGATITERMRVTAAGNVGIGVTDPVARFAVSTPTANSGNNTAYFQAPSIGPHASNIHFGTTGDWYVRSASGLGKVILQDTGGNVGIGTSSPTTGKLHVFDNSVGAAVYGNSAVSGGGFNIGGIGVFGNTQTADGVGVYGRNSFGGFAMYADGNTSQGRNKGGWVKALLKVSDAGGIERCYNGITGSAGGTCGFVIGLGPSTGLYDITFGFKVDDRFAIVTMDNTGFSQAATLIYGFGNENTIRVINCCSAGFTIIVY